DHRDQLRGEPRVAREEGQLSEAGSMRARGVLRDEGRALDVRQARLEQPINVDEALEGARSLAEQLRNLTDELRLIGQDLQRIRSLARFRNQCGESACLDGARSLLWYGILRLTHDGSEGRRCRRAEQ